MRVLANRILRRIFRSKRYEIGELLANRILRRIFRSKRDEIGK